LRRTFPLKVKPVAPCTGEHEETAAISKQALPESNRRARTSMAMVGLAISMGAYSMPLPNQRDGAIAAEPTVGEATNPIVPSPLEIAAISPETESAHSPSSSSSQSVGIRHTVQEGQTLWTVARFYGVDAATIASTNNISLDTVLRVGQRLVIPTDTRLAQTVETTDAPVVAPRYYGPVPGRSASPVVSRPVQDPTLKARQEQALEVLKQKRESLKARLSSPEPSTEDVSVQEVPLASKQAQTIQPVPTVLSQVQKPQSKPAVPTVLAPSSSQLAYNPLEHDQGSSESSTSHRVVGGETVATIARAYGVSVSDLIRANRISNPNYIFVDQVLVIPGVRPIAGRQEYRGAIAAIPKPSSSASLASPLPVTATTKVAASSLAGSAQPQSSEATSRLLQYNHVETLKSEIDQLRERYRGGVANPQVPVRQERVQQEHVQQERKAGAKPAQPTAVASSSAIQSDKVNPEFNPERYSTLKAQFREKLNQVRARQVEQTNAPSSIAPQIKPRPQVVAAAPLGSENYDPLVQSKIGQSVAPELPPLGSGSEYLPGAPGAPMAGYTWPTKGVLTSGFGWRWGRMHKGIDIAGPVGTPIVAAASGVVTYAGWNSGGYGYLVEIQHPDGSMTLYGHNNRILVQVGQQVAQGQQVSEMGSTGYSTGPHLHFEVHPSGKGAVNPIAFLPRS
jgi:murein DD-endopeptidase MepM/ murein hydrolase activator NlpD